MWVEDFSGLFKNVLLLCGMRGGGKVFGREMESAN
jgi:hypothetical protein